MMGYIPILLFLFFVSWFWNKTNTHIGEMSDRQRTLYAWKFFNIEFSFPHAAAYNFPITITGNIISKPTDY